MGLQMKRCQMVKSAYCPLSTWSCSKKGGIHQMKDPLLIGRWKRQRKSGSKGKWKRLFLQEKFSPVSVSFFDHFIETRSRLYFPLIDWIEVIDSLKPDKTRKSEGLCIFKIIFTAFSVKKPFWLSTFLGLWKLQGCFGKLVQLAFVLVKSALIKSNQHLLRRCRWRTLRILMLQVWEV